jgi:hypothetical protein
MNIPPLDTALSILQSPVDSGGPPLAPSSILDNQQHAEPYHCVTRAVSADLPPPPLGDTDTQKFIELDANW